MTLRARAAFIVAAVPAIAGAIVMAVPVFWALTSARSATFATGAQAPAQSTASTPSTGAFTIEPVTFPAPLDSGEPRLTVQGSRVLLSWLESVKGLGGPGSNDALQFAERTPDGWSVAQTVVRGPDLMVNASDVPFVRALSNGTLVAQWLRKHGPDPEAYDVQIARSATGGKTWSAPSAPYHDVTEVEHGFASLFETMSGASGGAGGFGLVWLDGRSGEDMALRTTTYGADGKAGQDTAIDTRVCECCQTAAAVTSDGPIVVYRDRSAADIRDIYATRLVAGKWSPPVPVHQDKWKIDGCPVNGPAVAATGRDVAVAWFTAPTSPGHTFVAFSSDAGRTFASPIRVDEVAATGRVEVGLLGDGSAVVSWIDFSSGRSQFRVRRIERTGARGPVATIGEGLGTQYPRMAIGRDELVFAWAENTRGTTRVRTARAAIPPAFRRRS